MDERQTVAVGIALAVFVSGVGVGYLLHPVIAPEQKAYEIRPGRRGFTNPLMDCEIRDFPPGRELRSFQGMLERQAEDFGRDGAVAALSVYFRDLDNGPWFGLKERDLFTPASLLKVPLIIACLKQAESDPAFLARSIRFDGAMALPSGSFKPEIQLEAGKSYAVEELIRRTAAYSDNTATALLKETVDEQVLRRVYADLGITEDLDLDPSRPAAISTYDYGRFFRVLYNASYLSREMSEKALGYFVDSSFQEGIVAGLPEGTTVSHKFGVHWLPEARPREIQLHDCGIVYFSPRPYFLCVMSRGKNYQDLKKVVAEVSRSVFREVSQQTLGPGGRAPE